MGCLEPEAIACRVNNGLVEKFDCTFARLWRLERDRNFLKLIASEGLYTCTTRTYTQIWMGAYIGTLAQNRVPFLSNNLAAQTWVGISEWAKANNIRGFAGLERLKAIHPEVITANILEQLRQIF